MRLIHNCTGTQFGFVHIFHVTCYPIQNMFRVHQPIFSSWLAYWEESNESRYFERFVTATDFTALKKAGKTFLIGRRDILDQTKIPGGRNYSSKYLVLETKYGLFLLTLWNRKSSEFVCVCLL